MVTVVTQQVDPATSQVTLGQQEGTFGDVLSPMTPILEADSNLGRAAFYFLVGLLLGRL